MTTRRKGVSDHTEVALSSEVSSGDTGQKSFQQKVIKEEAKAKTSHDGHYTLLNPAPHHPLHTTSASPSHPSFSSTHSSHLQRRRNVQGTSESSTFASSSTNDLPRGKRDLDLPKRTALDRLEGWFGLGDSGPVDRNVSSTSHLAPPPIRTKAPSNPNKTTRLVLVHTVLATDSLEALAIRYNSDVRTLRKANGLWPGDSVQVRKELYIPVDEDAVQTQTIGTNEIGISNGNETSNGKFTQLNGPPTTRHDRSMSSTSSSAATSTSHPHSSSAFGAGLGLSGSSTDLSVSRNSPELRRVPIQTLSHFPPPGQTPTGTTKGKGSEEQEAFGYGVGMKPDENMEPGESGVEDLLQLAERARLRGADSTSPPASDTTEANENHLKAKLPELVKSHSRDASTAASSPSLSTKALDEDWKPNKYRLGEKKRQPKPSTITNETDESRSAPVGPAMMVAVQSSSTSNRQNYQGWNDIPEPPLSKTAKGQVAHAYKPKKRYPRPGMVTGSEVLGNAFIDDLAAGLPANPGPAANWARPIGESLPIPAAERAKRNVSGNSRQTSGASSDAGWGQLFSDTVRGKMRLEDALERGWDDLRSGLLTSANGALLNDTRNGGYHTLPAVHAVASDNQPQRPSAEMARAALADTGGGDESPNPSQLQHSGTSNTHNSSSSSYGLQVDSGNGASVRRSSGKSMHELEDLRIQNETNSTYPKTWSATSAAKAKNGTTFAADDSSSGRTTTTTRRNVRNVDWLG